MRRQVRGDPEKVLTPGEDELFAAAPLYPCATTLKLLENAHFISGRRYAADGIDRLGSCPHLQGKQSREFWSVCWRFNPHRPFRAGAT
ncbi:hypothetical protein, partial [Oceanithermus sp.]